MFTGIITDIGTIAELEDRGDLRARIRCGYEPGGIAIGASIACDGICLTVVDRGAAEGGAWFDVDVSAETVARTNIRSGRTAWAAGRRINLERALRLGDELGGHIVSGHVDGRAEVVAARREGDSTRMTFRAPSLTPQKTFFFGKLFRHRVYRPGVTNDTHRTSNMAVFCDFENVALGAQDAKYDKFDIGKVLERLLVKGNIVVRKAYCDWGRYGSFKRAMHEANFELIDIPHVRQSGKNSADIRMVVDALDLCYTKAHLDTFVIVSGDSDFSPLVSKLRENNKVVIGVGVKNSTSDLFLSNCDEFLFYDDLVRPVKPASARRPPPAAKKSATASPGSPTAKGAASSASPKQDEAIDLVVETVEQLVAERGEDELVWGSMVKQAIKRRRPGFNESYHGFRGFNSLLEEAEKRGHFQLKLDEKSGGYVIRLVA